MNPTRKLNKRLEELESILRKYEILENMITNSDEGKTPRMFSFKRTNLIEWLEENREFNEKVRKEYQETQEQLKNLG